MQDRDRIRGLVKLKSRFLPGTTKGLTPFELGAEDVEEAIRAESEQSDTVLGAATGDAVAAMDLDCLLAVDREVGLARYAFDIDADG